MRWAGRRAGLAAGTRRGSLRAPWGWALGPSGRDGGHLLRVTEGAVQGALASLSGCVPSQVRGTFQTRRKACWRSVGKQPSPSLKRAFLPTAPFTSLFYVRKLWVIRARVSLLL